MYHFKDLFPLSTYGATHHVAISKFTWIFNVLQLVDQKFYMMIVNI